MAYAIAALAAFQVATGVQQSQLIQRQAALGREVDNMNADFAEIDAFNIENQQLAEVAAYRKNIDAILSDQQVAMATNGIDSTFGTASEIVEESRLNAFLNTLDLQNQARTSGLALRREARGMRMGGNFKQLEANARAGAVTTQSILSAGQTLASGYQNGAFNFKLGGGGGPNPNGHSGPAPRS